MMGERFRERGETLERMLASPARRAQSTAELFSDACGFSSAAIVTEPDLYFLGSGSIENVILQQPDQVHALMLVFHNPDITYLANSLDYNFRVDNIPTCGLLRLNCAIERWADWSPDLTTFDYYDFPKNDSGEVLRA